MDPVAKLLTDRLTERTGCQVVQVGDEPLDLLRKMVEEKKLEWKDVAYMGSDQQDVSCLNLAGMSAVPGDAPNVAINASKYTCRKMGGTGALREFAEHILLQKEKAKSHREQHRIDRINF
ncbi:N-acylneuraminate cytidylyltransferase-like [Gymnodraco acuticeps]|uniref:N-acylneuraminate cytidylyltransferase-like n=1 Tax=Gymnodraco acuticeps TaxID=8218 RepID=A0A6P8V422_GYMAC|nr:N-acylneuraminate cytidylyltransferase-like [Gymnodraco acuticeps]